MSNLSRKFMVALTGVVILAGVGVRQPSAQAPVLSPYIGASACKDCHSGQFTAWAETKHSNAFSKLQPADRASNACIKCHVTGSAEMIAAEGATPSFPNVQCEACHGPGRAHVDAALTGDSVTAKPKKTNEDTCLRCHNDTSPRFKPFYYQALVGMVHRKG
jgi:hypothetical protein